MGTNIDKFVTPAEIPAGNLPVGACVPWLSPTAGSPQPTPPTGFEYCDGTAVSTIGSPIIGLNKPSLMKTVAAPSIQQRFVRGADTTTPYGGATALVTGGNDLHNHTGNTSTDGTHSHTSAAHVHGLNNHTHSISNDGAHTHTTGSAGGAITSGGTVFTNSSGDHNHTAVTGASAGNTASTTPSDTGSSGSHSHTLSVSNGSTQPYFVELAWIIRVI